MMSVALIYQPLEFLILKKLKKSGHKSYQVEYRMLSLYNFAGL